MNQQNNQGLSFGSNNGTMPLPTVGTSSKKFDVNSIITTVLLVVLIGIGGFNLYLSYFPPYLGQNSNTDVLNEIAQLTEINKDDPNIFVAQISDVNELRGENEIQSEVYKDAQNGDYALAVEDRVIVYRRSEKKLIYNDKSPAKILQDQNLQLLTSIDNAAETVGISPKENEQPQLLVVKDAELQRQSDPTFYKDIVVGDIIAIYPTSERIMIYRPETQTVINEGAIKTSINVASSSN